MRDFFLDAVLMLRAVIADRSRTKAQSLGERSNTRIARAEPKLFTGRYLAWQGYWLALSLAAAGLPAMAQVPTKLPPVTPSAAAPDSLPALPDPIYWKQQLFLIPYKWNSTALPTTARTVSLFVSKDRGASWQKISDARPDVRSFNYRAEGDGEYWFAVRTLDHFNRWLPEGGYTAELRVVVDTTVPRIDGVQALPTGDGTIELVCRATDVNLDPNSLAVEIQTNATAPWQPVTLEGINGTEMGPLRTRFRCSSASLPQALKVKLSDRAGNATTYQIAMGTTGGRPVGTSQTLPAITAGNPFDRANRPVEGPSSAPPLGWYSGRSGPEPGTSAEVQRWPAGMTTDGPFRLWTKGTSQGDDHLTVFGNPTVAPLETAGQLTNSSGDVSAAADPRVTARYASSSTAAVAPKMDWTSGAPGTGPRFAPQQALGSGAGEMGGGFTAPSSVAPTGGSPPLQPKLVGSRTFALEYDLEGSPAGVARVDLWGTRDAGQSWSRFSTDNDNRSPLVVTVDGEGLYGFKILVQQAGDAQASSPQRGDTPELWVAVDLQRPIVELTSVQRGEGNLADHLILHWRAQDDNLEARPIALFFSSRPGGPWSAIATNLENTGQYAWRVERYVPSKVYLRVEARDTAGNLAAFQTREPIDYTVPQLTGRLRTAPAAPGR